VTIVDLSVVATDYELVSGTSFSGPHVAGVAALVKSVDPSLSPIQVRKIIETTAEPLGPNVIFGNGMVRADAAVNAAQ
jgi:subtilisin family serine protease